jgi:hypothetical protein
VNAWRHLCIDDSVCAAGVKSTAASHVMEVEEVEDFTNDFDVRLYLATSTCIRIFSSSTLCCAQCSHIELITFVYHSERWFTASQRCATVDHLLRS